MCAIAVSCDQITCHIITIYNIVWKSKSSVLELIRLLIENKIILHINLLFSVDLLLGIDLRLVIFCNKLNSWFL